MKEKMRNGWREKREMAREWGRRLPAKHAVLVLSTNR